MLALAAGLPQLVSHTQHQVVSKTSLHSQRGSAGSPLLPHPRALLGPASQDSTASAPYRTPLPLPLVEVLLFPCAFHALNSEPTSSHSFYLCMSMSTALDHKPQAHIGPLALFYPPISSVLGIRSQAHFGSLVSFDPSMISALDNKPSVGHLFYSIYFRLLYQYCAFGTSRCVQVGAQGK
jgi:hypothetical protein